MAVTKLSLLVAVFAALASGCEATPPLPSCGRIPEPDACPASAGGACSDPTCSAIYACSESGWQLIMRCPNPAPSDASGDAGGDEGGDGGDAGDEAPCAPGPVQTTNSCPPLETPDCDAQLIDGCPAQACATGCEGFLRCEGPDWSAAYVAYCDANGVFHQNPPP